MCWYEEWWSFVLIIEEYIEKARTFRHLAPLGAWSSRSHSQTTPQQSEQSMWKPRGPTFSPLKLPSPQPLRAKFVPLLFPRKPRRGKVLRKSAGTLRARRQHGQFEKKTREQQLLGGEPARGGDERGRSQAEKNHRTLQRSGHHRGNYHRIRHLSHAEGSPGSFRIGRLQFGVNFNWTAWF